MTTELQDHDELLRNYKKLQMQLELTNQTLYDCRRHMKTSQTIEAEYQEEIKLLQSQGTVEQQKLEAKIRHLEECNANLKATFHDQTGYLEKELAGKEDEVKDLKKEIDDIIKITGAQEHSIDDKILDEIADLKQENVDLSERLIELEKSLEINEQQKMAQLEKIKHLEEELENYKETLKCKREEIEEANNLIQNLKDDYLCVKSELDATRSKPLDDQSRGNSLFAEVDDRRLQLQQNMSLMKTQYVEMKRERASLLKQITMLRNENSTLIYKQQSEIEGKKRDEELIIDTYKDQIKTLNELIESYQNELKEKIELESSDHGIKYFDNLLAMKNAEIDNMRQKMKSKSLNYTSVAYDFTEANRQIRNYTSEIIQLKNEIGKLKVRIQEMEMLSPTETAPTQEFKLPKSVVKSTESEKPNDTDKENSKKNVQFAESTVDSKVTERSKLRKGAKILISKPIKYS